MFWSHKTFVRSRFHNNEILYYIIWKSLIVSFWCRPLIEVCPSHFFLRTITSLSVKFCFSLHCCLLRFQFLHIDCTDIQVFPDLNLEPGRLSNPFFYYSRRSIGIDWNQYQRFICLLLVRNQKNPTKDLESEQNEFESRFGSKLRSGLTCKF